MRDFISIVYHIVYEVASIPVLFLLSLFSRLSRKKYDVGIGPEPLINNIYHKNALCSAGYKVITFVKLIYYITSDFDVRLFSRNRIINAFKYKILYLDYLYLIFNVKSIYLYFQGGVFLYTKYLWRLEPYLLKAAGVKTVVMPYGGDVQSFDKTPNLLFKHAHSKDYPAHRYNRRRQEKKMELWTNHASHVISGCDWVDYMHHWDTLMVSHFSINVDLFANVKPCPRNSDSFRILHAPNHREIKGTQFVVEAVEKLKAEGHDVELVLVEKLSNLEILELILSVDLVIDQLIVGWYAMFAIESMLAGKPVICFLRDDLLNLYRSKGLIAVDEPPLINIAPLNLKEELSELILNQDKLSDYSKRGFDYVSRVHSTTSIGSKFDRINRSIGIHPSQQHVA